MVLCDAETQNNVMGIERTRLGGEYDILNKIDNKIVSDK